jgi:hypothetical protein
MSDEISRRKIIAVYTENDRLILELTPNSENGPNVVAILPRNHANYDAAASLLISAAFRHIAVELSVDNNSRIERVRAFTWQA